MLPRPRLISFCWRYIAWTNWSAASLQISLKNSKHWSLWKRWGLRKPTVVSWRGGMTGHLPSTLKKHNLQYWHPTFLVISFFLVHCVTPVHCLNVLGAKHMDNNFLPHHLKKWFLRLILGSFLARKSYLPDKRPVIPVEVNEGQVILLFSMVAR